MQGGCLMVRVRYAQETHPDIVAFSPGSQVLEKQLISIKHCGRTASIPQLDDG